jgi:hypothetical protein
MLAYNHRMNKRASKPCVCGHGTEIHHQTKETDGRSNHPGCKCKDFRSAKAVALSAK